MKLNKYKQSSEFNCGPTALAALLDVQLSIEANPSILEKELNCTEDNGTSHQDITDWLDKKGYDYIASNGDHILQNLPLLVNYQYDDDGHYGIILHIFENMVYLFNPWTAEIEHILLFEFIDSWYSMRYGKKWGLYLKKPDIQFPDCDPASK